MAEAPKPPSAAEDAFYVIGLLIILVILWFFAGGPGKADLRGLFLAPPPPLDSGNAYGPQIGTTSQAAQQTERQSGDSYYSQ